MQKDFMAMAQGQQAPAATPQQGAFPKEKLDAINLKKEDYEVMGMPAGNSIEDAKKRLLLIFEEFGVLKELTQTGLVELTNQIEDFVKRAQKEGIENLAEHPIGQLLKQIEQASLQPTGGPVPQQGAAPAAAPTDFASMMPPTPGGGMGGR